MAYRPELSAAAKQRPREGGGGGTPQLTGAFAVPPVDDPAEALRFCRALAAALQPSATLDELASTGPRLGFVSAVPAAAPVPMLSIVIPVLNEEENLPALYGRLTSVLNGFGFDYEIVFVDDGSQDQSPAILRRSPCHRPRELNCPIPDAPEGQVGAGRREDTTEFRRHDCAPICMTDVN